MLARAAENNRTSVCGIYAVLRSRLFFVLADESAAQLLVVRGHVHYRTAIQVAAAMNSSVRLLAGCKHQGRFGATRILALLGS